MMADQRNLGFPPGGQGNFGMAGAQGYPMMPQQFGGMHAAGQPMMQQQFAGMQQPNAAMMQQQQMMMQQQAQFRGQMFQAQPAYGQFCYYNQFVQSNAQFGATTTPGGQGAYRPPPYTTQMAQNFKVKQDKMVAHQAKMMEEQRKKMEQAIKARQFQEQQKKLREFSTVGTRKMDADSLINHIIGPSKPNSKPVPQPHQPGAMTAPGLQQQQLNQQQQQQPMFPVQNQQMSAPGGDDFDDDSFGDFMQGPTVPSSNHQSAVSTDTSVSQPANQVQPSMPTNQAQPSMPANQTPPSMPGPAASPPIQNENIQAQTAEEKKDLMSYMMECSDLNAPAKAKNFSKPSMREVQPQRAKTVVYQQSQKARQWAGHEENNLSELFTLPTQAPPQPAPIPTPAAVLPTPETGAPTPPPPSYQEVEASKQQPAWMPRWLTGEVPPPKVYLQVEEAVSRENKIDTQLVYPILLRSGLPRELLGQIWSVANRRTPGQLVAQELYMILALISVAQNNLDISNLEILGRCPQAPIPNLGQNQPAAIPFNETIPSEPPANATPERPPSVPPQAQSPAPVHAAGPPTCPMPAPGPVLTHHSQSAATLSSPEDEFADFQQAPDLPKSSSFGSFTAASPMRPGMPGFPSPGNPPENSVGFTIGGAPGGVPQLTSPQEMIGEEDIYSALRTLSDPPEEKEESGFADFKAADPVGPSQDLFPAAATLPVQPPTIPPSAAQEEFADFQSVTAPSVDEFADFQVAPSAQAPQPVDDKMAALKALVSDSKMYQAKPEESKADTSVEESEWDDFHKAGPARQVGTEDPGQPVVSAWESSMPSAAEEEPGGWADFGSVPPAPSTDTTASHSSAADWLQPEPEKAINWGFNSVMDNTPSSEDYLPFESGPTPGDPTSTTDKPQNNDKEDSKSSQQKRYDYFGRMIETKISAGTGMSPLDILPPDLPDMKDDEEDEAIDKFGTFQGIDGCGGTSYGGLDEDLTTDMFGFPTQPRPPRPEKEAADNISTSSSEFSGWKSKTATRVPEDSQSVNSLDLSSNKPRSSSKDGSPTVDTQSVSSLEFGNPAAFSRKAGTPGDDRSIASLEFKAVQTPDEGPLRDTSSFADFNSVSENQIKTDFSMNQSGSFGDFSSATEISKNEYNISQSESFGEFSSATDAVKSDSEASQSEGFGEFNSAPNGHTDFPTPQTENKDFIQRPRNASDLLATGEVSSFGGDRYSGLSNDSQESNHPSHSWERVLDKALQMLQQANNALSDVSSSEVLQEVLESEQGRLYLEGIVEVYRLVRKIGLAMKALSAGNAKLKDTLKEVETTWSSLSSYFCGTAIMPSEASMNFMAAVLKADMEDAQTKACGVCLLNVDARPRAKDYEVHKLTYGGRQYHSPCANFWVNCVDLMLPALKIPELL